MHQTMRLFIAFVLLLTGVDVASAITLVQEGRPTATIVIRDAAFKVEPYVPAANIPADPNAKIKLAALELQKYLEKISGAKLVIGSDADAVNGAVILVGPSRPTEEMKVEIPSGLTNERKEEGYVILARGDVLVLAGNDVNPYCGTFYAVAELLNRLGVRWFMPGDFGEIVPHRATVDVADVEFRDRPDFLLRTWWGHTSPDNAAQESLWKLRNKMQLSSYEVFSPPGDSSLRAYLPEEKLAASHPEYFAKRPDGTTDPFMPSLSNPEVPKMVAEKVKAALAKARQEGKSPNSIGFSPDDGIPIDYGALSADLNQGFTEFVGREGVVGELSVSEEWFRFVNQVVAEVVKEYPDIIFTANGYANRSLVPEGLELHPNLSIMFAPIWADTLKPFDAPNSWHGTLHGNNLKRWCEKNRRVWIYGYNYNMLVSCLTPVPTVSKIRRTIPQMHEWGVVGFMDETRLSYMEHGIPTYYLRARLEWDAELDVDAALAEFFQHWYGPAARPGRAYWDALEEAVQKSPVLGHEDRILPYLYTDELMASLEQAALEAESLAQVEPYATRVKVDRLILEHLKGYREMHAAEFAGNYAEAARQTDRMFEQRRALNAVSTLFVMPEAPNYPERFWSGTWYWNLGDRKAHYQKLAEMTGGSLGELVAMAPREAKFALDAADLGKYEYWYAPDYDRSTWRTLDCTVPFYLQGYLNERGIPQHRGLMWYEFDTDVPAAAAGKTVKLYAPVVIAEAWVWMNGKYIGHRKYQEAYIRPAPLDFDVTGAVEPGKKNTIAVRVSTGMNLTQAPDGFQGRLFLYSPK